MSQKVFRDPLYNYVGVDTGQDRWLLDVIDSREFQRLRRIHQLGVSNFTYTGADHSRLCHSLGVLHLMQLVLDIYRRLIARSNLRVLKQFSRQQPSSMMLDMVLSRIFLNHASALIMKNGQRRLSWIANAKSIRSSRRAIHHFQTQ